MVSPEEIQGISKITGEVRGAVFQTDAAYIVLKQGEPGLQRVEESLERHGFPIKYKRIKAMEWLPLKLRAIALLVMKDAFDWRDEDIKTMGDAAPKYSFIIRLLARFMTSPKTAFMSAPGYWAKHYTVGKLVPVTLNEAEQYAVLYLKDIAVHACYCKYLEGYFRRLVQNVLPGKTVRVSEEKCILKGDTRHEYRFTWQ